LYPKVYLTVDNCFASKRWTDPGEWMQVVRDIGIRYVEASADNECDPGYTTEAYRKDWVKEVQRASERTGVRVCTLYSGHGSYSTLGLTHTDERVRNYMVDTWIRSMCETAGALGAGLGFFCHAFSSAVLQDPALYREYLELLYVQLVRVACYAEEYGCKCVGVENMYSPHQVPWTLDGTDELLHRVNAESAFPFYISVDVGHQVGQQRFLMPTQEALEQAVRARRNGAPTPWLGIRQAYELFDTAAVDQEHEQERLDAVFTLLKAYPYLFSNDKDTSTRNWIERFGRYSPIIHLQQTDGLNSSHLPFTPEMNETGIVQGDQILRWLHTSFSLSNESGMPPEAQEIFLTLEVFSKTTDTEADIINRMEQSVAYWRRFIPQDGMGLEELLHN